MKSPAAKPQPVDVPVAVSARMRKQRTRDTQPELALRSSLHRLGLRYRLHRAPLAGLRRSADVVFRRPRIAVFVDGCYWHGCPEHASWPRRNASFWQSKILSNRLRDGNTDEILVANGWTVIRVWEHEDMADAADLIAEAVRAGQASRRTARQERRRVP